MSNSGRHVNSDSTNRIISCIQNNLIRHVTWRCVKSKSHCPCTWCWRCLVILLQAYIFLADWQQSAFPLPVLGWVVETEAPVIQGNKRHKRCQVRLLRQTYELMYVTGNIGTYHNNTIVWLPKISIFDGIVSLITYWFTGFSNIKALEHKPLFGIENMYIFVFLCTFLGANWGIPTALLLQSRMKRWGCSHYLICLQ